jgi:hypothetical protein
MALGQLHGRSGVSSRVKELASFLWGIWENHGGLELVGFRTDPARIPPHFAVGIVHSPKKGFWLTVQVGFDPDLDYRVISLMVVPSRPPMDLVGIERLDETGISAELLSYAASMASKEEFSGSILLARDGKVLFNRAFGLASREQEGGRRRPRHHEPTERLTLTVQNAPRVPPPRGRFITWRFEVIGGSERFGKLPLRQILAHKKCVGTDEVTTDQAVAEFCP